ncbi:DUF3772 domain-containing protein [Thalassovita sp.]|uniref:DUF3772 domain-containing protein n=1 Tax=Thalassovita sp. TaxID=1979401 RepID=UPI0029DE851B|nr:DUF3772 domain-containing protein [Thalassovita sp.]
MLRLFLSLWLACVVAAPLSPVYAQETPLAQDAGTQAALDYEAWESIATRAEDALEVGRASNAALETLRADIAAWRDKFAAAQNTNKSRIDIVQSQITALGAVPENGEESAEIAARRAELTAQLTRLQAPVLTAEEAHRRAAGLIAEIDRIIRERQAEELISLGPSPLNPLHWTSSVLELYGAFDTLWQEVQSNWTNEVRQAEFRQSAPVSAAIGLVGIVLLLRGRRWFGWLEAQLTKMSPRGVPVWQFLLSLGKVVMPQVGLLIVAQAIIQTGFVGLHGATVLNHIPAWGLGILAARWLADRLFPDTGPALVPVEPARRGEARGYATILAVLVVLSSVVGVLGVIGDFSIEAEAVIGFPVALLTGLVLFRSGQFLSRQIEKAKQAEEQIGYRNRLLGLLSRAAQVAAVVGPLMWAVGYQNAADALIYPAVQTVGLLGVFAVLRKLITDIYCLITRAEDDASEALWPVLIGFGLALALVPVLALIWGARVAELTEVWARFREGFAIGDTRISPTDFLVFVLVFGLGYMLTRVVQGTVRSSILPKTKIDPGGQNAIVAGLGYVGIFTAAVVAISSAGLDLSSLAIVAGALSVGIGFGLQNIVSNFVSGIILLIERPVAEGDWIEVGGKQGYVRDISVRSTRIETFDRTDVIIPNADLVSGTVTNFTRGNTIGRLILPVGVAYGTDTMRVDGILREIAEAHPMVLLNPKPNVIFQGFGADSLNFEIRAILRDVNWSMTVRSELNHEIARRFAEEKIEIPFAQRDIWLRNPEALTGARPAAAKNDPEGQDT